jgi:hypothetical protein
LLGGYAIERGRLVGDHANLLEELLKRELDLLLAGEGGAIAKDLRACGCEALQRDAYATAGDFLGELVDGEADLGFDVVGAGPEEMGGDARQDIAEVEDDLLVLLWIGFRVAGQVHEKGMVARIMTCAKALSGGRAGYLPFGAGGDFEVRFWLSKRAVLAQGVGMTYPPEFWGDLLWIVCEAIGATLVLLVIGLPFAANPVRQALRRVPRDVLDAARMDGASALGTLWRVTLPYAGSRIVAAGLAMLGCTLGVFGFIILLSNIAVAGSRMSLALQAHVLSSFDLGGIDMGTARDLWIALVVIWLVMLGAASFFQVRSIEK